MSQQLENASNYAFVEFEKHENDLTKLPIPLLTLVLVCSAQGIIDNGGFKYFFESDFPNHPPYSSFSDAYQRIGAEKAGCSFEKAVALFPFDAPHLHATKRQKFLESLDKQSEFWEFERSLCGNQSVWKKLEAYINQNLEFFRIN